MINTITGRVCHYAYYATFTTDLCTFIVILEGWAYIIITVWWYVTYSIIIWYLYVSYILYSHIEVDGCVFAPNYNAFREYLTCNISTTPTHVWPESSVCHILIYYIVIGALHRENSNRVCQIVCVVGKTKVQRAFP